MTTLTKETLAGAMAVALLILAGCRTAPRIPPVPPTPPPSLEKTLGDVSVDGRSLSFLYKDMRVLVDPNSAELSLTGATADFILFTGAGSVSAGSYRAGQKAIGPADAAEAARRAGIAGFKAMGTGQRLMISKKDVFAFVSAVQGKGPGGETANGYLLEFDNGRNIMVLPLMPDASPVREFVYGLRDDGKEAHLGFFALTAAGTEKPAAELAALIQPRVAVFTGFPLADHAALKTALEEAIFNGEWRVSTRREPLTF